MMCSITLLGCENKRVTDTFSSEEITKLVKKDSLYVEVIRNTEITKDIFSKDLILKSKFDPLGLSDYYDYYKFVMSEEFFYSSYNLYEKYLQKTSDSVLNIYRDQIDDSISFYREVYDNINPSKFVEVKWTGTYFDFDFYSNDINDYDVEGTNFYDVHFLKQGTIKFIKGKSSLYYISHKSNYPLAVGHFYSVRPKDGGIISEVANEDFMRYFKQADFKEKKEYRVETEILSLTYNGIEYSIFSIPSKYREFSKTKDTLTRQDYLKFIEENYYFDVEYESSKYMFNYQDSIKKSLNHLAFEYEELINRYD